MDKIIYIYYIMDTKNIELVLKFELKKAIFYLHIGGGRRKSETDLINFAVFIRTG